MKRFLTIALFALSIASCNDKEVSLDVDKPEDLIAADKMVEVLTDITIIEGAYQMKYIQVSRYNTLLQQAADSVFQAQGVTREAYESSMNYYTQSQEELIDIYSQVKKNIEDKKAVIEIF